MTNGDKFLTELKLHFAFTGMPVHYSCRPSQCFRSTKPPSLSKCSYRPQELVRVGQCTEVQSVNAPEGSLSTRSNETAEED